MSSIAILGASNNRNKYGNRAVRTYLALGWTVYPVNLHQTLVEGIPAYRSIADLPETPDRVSLYLPPELGIAQLDAIRKRGVRELWVNPGAGSPALIERAQALGLTTIEACSIVAAREADDTPPGKAGEPPHQTVDTCRPGR